MIADEEEKNDLREALLYSGYISEHFDFCVLVETCRFCSDKLTPEQKKIL